MSPTDFGADGPVRTPSQAGRTRYVFADGGCVRPAAPADDDWVVVGFGADINIPAAVWTRGWGEGWECPADPLDIEPPICPCGGEPRPVSDELPDGSPYCSYDCEPNWRGPNTSSDIDGTAMNWRPDLVSAHVDRGLISTIMRHRRGAFWGEVFERAGTDSIHLRLDDGHRFVGADLVRTPDDEDGFVQAYADKWKALERELVNNRSTVPGIRPRPDAAINTRPGIAIDFPLPARPHRWSSAAAHPGGIQVGRNSGPRAHRPAAGYHNPYAGSGGSIYGNAGGHIHFAMNPSPGSRAVGTSPSQRIANYITLMGQSLTGAHLGLSDAIARLSGQARSEVVNPPANVRARALWLRQNRNTGPQVTPRAPRAINPTRGR
jgi:hypothetical protein